MGSMLCMTYKCGFLRTRNSVSEPVLFADDMSNSSNIGTTTILQKKIIKSKPGAQPRASCIKQIHLYTVSVQGISTIVPDQIPTYLF